MAFPLWRLTTLRRKVFESVGSDRYSRPATPAIHQRLLEFLGGSGRFVEVGALDGFFESNTYYLERFCNWHGILIEPIPRMYERLRVNRPRARTFNCALVSDEFESATIRLLDQHAMSRVDAVSALDATAESSHPFVDVPARTLTSVLSEAGVKNVDFLSLDVEGLELEALSGLDFRCYRPRFILVECLSGEKKQEMDAFLATYYRFVDKFTYRDFFYEAVQPSVLMRK